jgi:hypothetical protein
MRFALGLVGVLAAIAVPGASAGDFDGDNGPCRETPGDAALLRCPTGYVGAPYEVTIATDPDSGCYPYIRIQIVKSALPAGLSMTQSGEISGVPTGAGLTRFWLRDVHGIRPADGARLRSGVDNRKPWVDRNAELALGYIVTGAPGRPTFCARHVVIPGRGGSSA